MLQILKWFDEDSEITDGLDIIQLLWAAFLHDVGKGSQCGFTKVNDVGVIDTYSMLSYDGLGDSVHPQVSANIILGTTPIYKHCLTVSLTKELLKLDLDDRRVAFEIWKLQTPKIFLTQDFFFKYGIDRQMSAVTARLHWDLGNVNNKKMSIQEYLQKFRTVCHSYSLKPTLEILKSCLAISIADVIAGQSPCDDKCGQLCHELSLSFPVLGDLCQHTKLDSTFPSFSAIQRYYGGMNGVLILRLNILETYINA
jgi:hypothetical protein